MPYKRTYGKKRTYRKKTYKKTYKKYNKKSNARLNVNSERLTYMMGRQTALPFPPRYKTKLTFSVYGILEAGDLDGIGEGRCWVNLNSPYHPIENTSWGPLGSGPFTLPTVSHATIQPAAFSQICNATLYQSFRCYGSSIKITLTPKQTADNIELAITPSNQTGAPIAVATAMARPYSKRALMQVGKGKLGVNNYMSTNRLLGVTKSAIQNDLSGQFIGTFGTNPASQQYWIINVAKPNTTDSDADMDFEMTVTYYVEFFDLATYAFPLA